MPDNGKDLEQTGEDNKPYSEIKQEYDNTINGLEKLRDQVKEQLINQEIAVLDKQYETATQQLDILTSDSRSDSFQDKPQNDLTDLYNQMKNAAPQLREIALKDLEKSIMESNYIQDSSKDKATYGKAIDQFQKLGPQLTDYVRTKTESDLKLRQSTFDEIGEQLQTLNIEIGNYNHLIDSSENADSKVAERTLKTKNETIESAKTTFTSTLKDFNRIGEVAISSEHYHKMEQALKDFQQATHDLENFLNGLKEIDLLQKKENLDKRFQTVQESLNVLTMYFRTNSFEEQNENEYQSLKTSTLKQGEVTETDWKGFVVKRSTSSQQTEGSLQKYQQGIMETGQFQSGLQVVPVSPLAKSSSLSYTSSIRLIEEHTSLVVVREK